MKIGTLAHLFARLVPRGFASSGDWRRWCVRNLVIGRFRVKADLRRGSPKCRLVTRKGH